MVASKIAYGGEFITATLPERTQILEPPPALAPLENPEQAIRDALYSPIAHDPISKLVGSKSRVTIAFDDPVIPQIPMKRPDFREMTITILLEELEKVGVKRSNIRLICANALHRKFTNGELSTILGTKIALAFGPNRLYCHDAEDGENLVLVGETERGFEVEVNKAVMESDQLFYVNITSLPFHGGWK